MGEYTQAFTHSIQQPDAFWAAAAAAIDWSTAPTVVLDRSNDPLFRWFPDGRLNTCYNALDRHVESGRADQAALYYVSPVTNTYQILTYGELRDAVALFAGALAGLGLAQGDRVVLSMPMIPEAVIAMLACARLGAVHSVVFGGFAAEELAVRIDDAEPKVVLSASCGIETQRTVAYKPLLDEALHIATHQPEACVILQRPQLHADMGPIDHDWQQLLAGAAPVGCTDVAATDPLYILYTSGTTGKPKGVVRDNGGHAVALSWSMTNVYDIGPGDVWWAASDVGWVVGHSYIVYAPLLVGATTVLYEGKPVGTPDAAAFWRVIDRHKVKALFTAPTAIRSIRREDPEGGLIAEHDISSLRTLFLAGERLDPDTYHWATAALGVPVVDNWWQTETGWPIAASPRGLEPLPLKEGSPSVPIPGYDVHVVDGTGVEVGANTEGNIVLKLPLPPGTLPTLWHADQRFIDSYLTAFPGYYTTGDGGFVDEDGYLYVLGRTDDEINVAGHRLSTGVIEAAVATHPSVAECAVIGVNDPLKGQSPKAFVVLKTGIEADPDGITREIVAAVREHVGPVAAMKEVVIVPGLPKTRSGKILRRTMRGIADGRPEAVPSTIEDVQVLEAITPLLRNE
jgi:propionyl-CoA synthetase